MFDDTQPIYQQIAQQVRDQVLTGELSPGQQVMSTTQYALTYKINPATAAKAFALLVNEGVLEKRRGVGMFVTASAKSKLQLQQREQFFAETFAKTLWRASLLDISQEELIAAINATWTTLESSCSGLR